MLFRSDLEVLQLALDSVQAFGISAIQLDMADARVVRALLAGIQVDAGTLTQVHAALAAKDATELRALTRDFPQASRDGLLALLQLFGGIEVLDEAEKCLSDIPGMTLPLSELQRLAAQLNSEAPV